MSNIEGTLIVINPEKNGSSFVVPAEQGRPRLSSLCVRRDAVLLIDVEGNPHLLEEVEPTQAQSAASLGVLIVREESLDSEDFVEYPIAKDVDLAIDSEHATSGWKP